VEHGLIIDIGICIIAAWVMAVVCQAFKQPLLIAYLLAGFACGPNGFSWVTDQDSIKTIADIGLILLLFMIGLEMDLKTMFSTGKAITVTGLVQILGCVALGWVFFRVTGLGGTRLETLYLAVAAAMSSTIIIIKILHDKRELETLPGRITIGILVLQDLAVILFLAIQPNLRNPALSEVARAFGKVLLLVGVAYLFSRFLLPRMFKAVSRQPELVLVGALAWCFAMSGLANGLGLSGEMGALVAGVMVSTFPYTLDVVAKVTSIRDFFVTLFFVGLGMSIPIPTWTLLALTLVTSLFIVVSRLVTVFVPLYRMKLGHRVSLLPAINLCQMSELSLVVLALGRKDISETSMSVAAFTFSFLAIGSTYAISQNDRLLRKLSPWLTRLGMPDLGTIRVESAQAQKPPRIFLLGFSWTASSLLAEITREKPALLSEIQVVDFNPEVHEKLKERGVRATYGDVSQRDSLVHAGISRAEVIICSLPDMVLKGTNNLKLLQQLRELNPKAQIIVHAEKLTETAALYAAGASYVTTPRMLEAADLLNALDAVEIQLLEEKRKMQAELLQGRQEVIP